MHKLLRSRALLLGCLATVAGNGFAASLTLEVRSDIPHLQLGSAQHADVFVASPVDLDAMQVSASCGKIDEVQRIDARHFRVRYVPPQQTFPQLAFVVAVGVQGRSRWRGWMALPLWGAGEASVLTRPRARVVLQVGDASYGPVLADARGRASVAIQVPPGIQSAFDGHKLIDLQLPALSLHHAEVDSPSVSADREQAIPVRVFATDETGRPRSHALIEWHATRGAVSASVESEPGLYEGTWTIPSGKVGSWVLEGRIAGDPAPQIHLRVQSTPGPATRLEVSTQPSRYLAGSSVPVVATVTMFDRVGNATTGEVRLFSDVGVCVAQASMSARARTFSCQLDDHFEEHANATLTAQAESATAQARVALIPGEARRVRFFHAAQLQPDATTMVKISVSDSFGNPTPNAPTPEAEVNAGRVEPAHATGVGRYELAVWVARDAETVTLDLHAGTLPGRETLAVARWYPTASLDVKAGWFANGAELSGPALALTLGLWGRPLGLPPWSLDADVALLRSVRATAAGADPSFRATHTLVQSHLLLARSFAAGPRWRIQLGGGVGGSFVSSATSVGSAVLPVQSAWAPSALVSASVRRRMGPGSALLELRTTAMADPHLDVWSGALIGFFGTVGYSFEL